MTDDSIRIIELDPIAIVKDADILPIIDSSISDPNADTKKVTIKQIKDNINAYTKTEANVLIDAKANLADVYTKIENDNLLNSKVDKIAGKQLSTEDYTTAEKNKLSGIEIGAEVNTVDLSDIPNKTSQLANDSDFITQTNIDNHNISNTSHQDIRNLIANIEIGIGDIDDYISSDEDNQIIKGSDDRLYVAKQEIVGDLEISVVNTDSISLTLTEENELTADINISEDEDNAIIQKEDGIYVAKQKVSESQTSTMQLLFLNSFENKPVLSVETPKERTIILPITWYGANPDVWQEITRIKSLPEIGNTIIEFMEGNRFSVKLWFVSEIAQTNAQIRIQAIDVSDDTILASATSIVNLLNDGITPIPVLLENIYQISRNQKLSKIEVVVSVMPSSYGVQVGIISNPPNEISYINTISTSGDGVSGSLEWGNITGDIESQIDLNNKLNAIELQIEEVSDSIPIKTSELENDSNFLTLADYDVEKIDILVVDGDGTKYLSDSGEYKTIVSGGDGGIGVPVNTNNVYVAKDIKFTGMSLGNYNDGDIVVKDTLLSDFLFNISQKRIPPQYASPKLTIIGSSPLSIEIGSNLAPSITASYVQGDAGVTTNYSIKRDNISIFNVANVQSFTDSQAQMTKTVKYLAVVSYEDGIILNDNFSEPNEVGRIMAGTIESNTIEYTVFRNCFYQSVIGDTLIPTTSAQIRALTGKFSNPINGSVIDMLVPSGTTKIVISYPSTLQNVSKILSSNLNIDIKEVFDLTTINVAGANSYLPILYKTYTYVPAIPYSSNDTFLITI